MSDSNKVVKYGFVEVGDCRGGSIGRFQKTEDPENAEYVKLTDYQKLEECLEDVKGLLAVHPVFHHEKINYIIKVISRGLNHESIKC